MQFVEKKLDLYRLTWSRINNNNKGFSDKSFAFQQTKMIAYHLRAVERTSEMD